MAAIAQYTYKEMANARREARAHLACLSAHDSPVQKTFVENYIMFRRTLVVTLALGLGTLAGCNEAKDLLERQKAKAISEAKQNADKKLDDARHGEMTKGTPDKDKADKMRDKSKDDE